MHQSLANLTREAALPAGGGTDTGSDSSFLSFIRAVTEGMALLVGLMAIETLFLGRGTYAALDLHPFWLPVMLVSLQYGVYGGVVTAILASLFMDWPLRPPGLDISAYYLEMVRLPIQWLLAAVLIGLFRQNQRRTEIERAREIERLRRMNTAFADEIRRLDEELWQLEVAIATEAPAPARQPDRPPPSDLGGAPEMPTTALREATAARLAEELQRCARDLLGPVTVRLFLRCPRGDYREVGDIRAAGASGEVLPADHPIVRRAAAEAGPVTVKRAPEFADGVAAIAVRGPDEEVPVGILAIPFGRREQIGDGAVGVLTDALAAALAGMKQDDVAALARCSGDGGR
jgi:hypothetical protein